MRFDQLGCFRVKTGGFSPTHPEKYAQVKVDHHETPRFGVKINNTWVFPKNNATLKSSILIGFSIINHPFWGTPIFRNIHLSCHHLLTYSVRILSESTSGFPKAGLGLGRLLRRLWRCLFGLKTPETRRRHPC